jgi:hypothetical protein
MKNVLTRLSVGFAASMAIVVPLAGAAFATAIPQTAARTGKFVQVGPIADNGFPSWYRDSNNVRLELCTDLNDALCNGMGTLPNPDAPTSFPDNFPDEAFYQLADNTFNLTSTGAKVVVSTNLEAAFATGPVIPGDQMVFGRIRIRFDAPAGQRFRVTQPYGVDDVTSDDKNRVFVTEDTGITPGAFGQALGGRVGPFLKWDPNVAPSAPAGYIGNPAVTHTVVGSPYNTNFVRIEQLDPTTGAVIGQIGFSDQFTLQGRLATNAGVDVDQATYSVGSDGTGFVEVYATSEPGQAIEVVANPALGFRGTRLREDTTGHYYGRFPVTQPITSGASIEVVNNSDRPVAHKTKALSDVVRITQLQYNADAQTLTVAATSSDQRSTAPTLTVTGFGPITGSPFTGVKAPPASVTVTSSSGGTTSAATLGTGALFRPAAPVAGATANTPAITGQTVTLDGSGSTGEIDSYAWTQTAGPAVTLTGATSPTATFKPTTLGQYVFSLVVTGPGGVSTPTTVTIDVINATPATANAGVDQTVVRGTAVALDGSRSAAVESYSWRQLSGPTVTLNGATTAKPTFTYPLQLLPAAPGPNAGYVANNAPVVLELTVRNPAGIGTDQVVIRPATDGFTGLTARYRTGNNEWRIAGNTTLLAGQRVTAVLGPNLTGRIIGAPVAVDAAGAFAIRVTGPAPGAVRTISFISTTGGQSLSFPVTVTN